jgi:hypothetical protein
MSTILRRMIDVGPGGALRPGSAADLRFHDNRVVFAETSTPWVRLWADWPTLQPDPLRRPDDPESPGAPFLAALDDQIAVANADGIKVLLQLFRFPLWTNGLESLGTQVNTDAEVAFAYADRMSPAAWAAYVAAGRDPARVNPSRRSLEYRVPPDGLGPESAWATFFAFCHERWRLGRRGSGPYVHGFELVNEPNYFWWPQRVPADGEDPFAVTELSAPGAVAELMHTAAGILAPVEDGTLLLAPSIADTERGGRTITAYDAFTPKLLDALDAIGHVAGPREVWAHHDYNDLERRATETSLQRVRRMLTGRWSGFVEGEAPTVFVTEGGVRVSRMRSSFPDEDPLQAQALSWQLGWERHFRDDGAGAGVGMLTQYLTYSDPRFDCGLLDPWPALVRRPVYDTWGSFPRFE